jgi:uncharacterized membrane protein (UPF0127 family)
MRVLKPAAFAAFVLVGILPAKDLAGQTAGPREQLTITTDAGAREFEVEIADDDRERAMGLMFRRSMGEDEGMLFDFGGEERASFWMRNTYIPLDMLFIKADGTIESIAKRTTPLSEKSVPSRGAVRYVLEINGGVSDALGIKSGDKLSGAALTAR